MRDIFKSLQLRKPTVEMNGNPDAGSQKLEVGSFMTLLLIFYDFAPNFEVGISITSCNVIGRRDLRLFHFNHAN